MATIKVSIVDDSVVIRNLLGKVLGQHPKIQVIHMSHDPIFALRKMQEKWPDVIISDIEMPRMDGLTFLKKIMQEKPTPVIIMSSLTEKNVKISLEAMKLGALDVIDKPSAGLDRFLKESAPKIIELVLEAAKAKILKKNFKEKSLEKINLKPLKQKVKLIAIGASTGGTHAIETILTGFGQEKIPPIVVTQHMPPGFTKAFAERLNRALPLQVFEAKGQEVLKTNMVAIAPGDKHLIVRKNHQGEIVTTLLDTEKVNRHKPSVGVLFDSVAQEVAPNTIAILLTGIGNDGAAELKKIKQKGGATIGQDENTCAVYGMPKAAKQMQAVTWELPLHAIAKEVLKLCTP